eukprot:jgi/Chlat1/6833/Chrsp51S06521
MSSSSAPGHRHHRTASRLHDKVMGVRSRARAKTGIGGGGHGGHGGGGSTASKVDEAMAQELMALESLQHSLQEKEYDAEGFVKRHFTLFGEKKVRMLCEELQSMKQKVAADMRTTVYTNYSHYIRTSKEMSDLEAEVLSLRGLLSSAAAVVNSLQDVPALAPTGVDSSTSAKPQPRATGEDNDDDDDMDEEMTEGLDAIDVLLAERRVDAVIDALEEGAEMVREMGSGAAEWERALAERRHRLAEMLVSAAHEPSAGANELRGAVAAFARLGDRARAHALLLACHSERLQRATRSLRPTAAAGSGAGSSGSAYVSEMSQMVFATVAAAARDATVVFGTEPGRSSALLLWAIAETERRAALLKRNVLAFTSSGAAGFHTAVECFQIASAHCAGLALQQQGLALLPVLERALQPSLAEALSLEFARLEEAITAAAIYDDWQAHPCPELEALAGQEQAVGLLQPVEGGLASDKRASTKVSLTSSGLIVFQHVQDFIVDAGPVAGMLLPAIATGLTDLYEKYLRMLGQALAVGTPATDTPPSSSDGSTSDATLPESSSKSQTVRLASTAAQQLAVMVNATAIGEGLLVHSMKQLVDMATWPEQDVVRLRVLRASLKLKDLYCSKRVGELVQAEGSSLRLPADGYLSLDRRMAGRLADVRSRMPPSPPVQALLRVMQTFQAEAAASFPWGGRGAVALQTRLLEAVVVVLAGDAAFWVKLQSGKLGIIGLQQLYVDLHFVLEMATAGGYHSRGLRKVVLDSLQKAIELCAVGADALRDFHKDLQEAWFRQNAALCLHELSRANSLLLSGTSAGRTPA